MATADEPLILKVMRLTRRCAVSTDLSPVTAEPPQLLLPTQVLDVYAGESFQAFLFVSNESLSTPAFNVSVSAEVEGARVASTEGLVEVEPGKYFECAVSFELPQTPGTAVLVVALSYYLSRFGEQRQLRRTYKLQLVSPLACDSRVVQLGREVSLLEVSVASNLKQPLTVQRLSVEAVDGWQVDVNKRLEPTSLIPVTSVKQKVAHKPELKQTFRLTSCTDGCPGKVVVDWIVPAVGSQGRTVFTIPFSAPKPPDLSLIVSADPDKKLIVTPGEIFTLDLEITNFSNEAKTPVLVLDFDVMGNLASFGAARKTLDELGSGEKMIHQLPLVAGRPGILQLKGVSLEGYVSPNPILASVFATYKILLPKK